MLRKGLVNLLALVAVVILAGVSLAATASFEAEPAEDLALDCEGQADVGSEGCEAGDDQPGDDEAGDDQAGDDPDGDAENEDGGAGSDGGDGGDSGDDDVADAGDFHVDELVVEDNDNGDGFGAVRSAEVRQWGECMEATAGDRDACAEFKPRPAWQTPGHPTGGPAHKDDEVGAAGSSTRGRPDHAGQGKPDHAGQGKPDHAGQGKAKGKAGR